MTSSGDWQRVAKLRPSLRAHILIRPQVYRGERWYLLHDRGTGRSLRLNRSAYAFIARLDGEVSVEEARQDLRTAIGDETPTQDEAIKGMLHEIGIDYAQGYGIGRPRPLDELVAGLAGRPA